MAASIITLPKGDRGRMTENDCNDNGDDKYDWIHCGTGRKVVATPAAPVGYHYRYRKTPQLASA